MPPESLFERIVDLQQEIDRELEKKSEEFHYRVEQRKVAFEQQIRAEHRKLRVSAFNYMVRSGFLSVLFAPVIYSVILPLVLLDLFVSVFQLVCFPVYGIEKVRRADFIAVDRQHLAYLNWIEKLNCVYCGYANGLLAYARAIAGRTEEHWCPIKHARRLQGLQPEYWRFADYGDADGYRRTGAQISAEHLAHAAEHWIEGGDGEKGKSDGEDAGAGTGGTSPREGA
jgi:hypothetical protein